MAKSLAVLVEMGPKGKRHVAFARDWPGFERGGKSVDLALETLKAYVPRYAKVAKRAGYGEEFAGQRRMRVVEQFEGVGSTDFWGVSFAIAASDRAQLGAESLDRQLKLMKAAWAEFDAIGKRVSVEMQKGPKGGGRDREAIRRHVLVNEEEWAKVKLGIDVPARSILTPEGLRRHRSAYCSEIRRRHAASELARTWPLPYLIRHTAYHALDHAWEMEDKDLSRS